MHTVAALDGFDGISYCKGASFLKQLNFMHGEEMFKKALRSYFAQFQYKNTKLEDLIQHLNKASGEMGGQGDLSEWFSSWLKTSGCNLISHSIEEEGGKIKKFVVNQKVHKYGDSNRLRVQKYQVAFLD